MENKLGRRAALVTPTPLAGDSLPEPQGSAFPWLLLSLHSQRQAACNPTATPKALCFSGPHANPKYQRHDSQVPGPEGLPEHPAAHRTSRLLTRAPPSGVGGSQLLHSLPRGCPRNTPRQQPARSLRHFFIFLTTCCWGPTVSQDSKKNKICHLKELGTKTLHKLKG